MPGTLKDQLLKAGLVDPKKLKSEKKARHKAKKQRARAGKPPPEDAAKGAEAARRDKVERDRQSNSERERQRALRAVRAQVKEIVERHRLEREGGETPFQFDDRGKIKKIYVHEPMPADIAAGRLAIVRLEGRYDVVPASVGSRIAERDPRSVIVLNDGSQDPGVVDDEYADFPVPDDITW